MKEYADPRKRPEYALYQTQNEPFASEHYVEDARSFRGKEQTPPKKRKKKGRLSGGSAILLTVMITLLAFSLTLFTADLIGSGSGLRLYASLFQKASKTTSYYALYATHSEDMSVAYKNATVIREEGGAGYVMKEGDEYYVVLNVYAEESDAKKIAERKSNYGVLEIVVHDFNVKKQPSLSAAENTKDVYKEAYLALYEAANDLASGKYGKQDMLRALLASKEKVIAVEKNYAESIKGSEDSCAIEYKVILAEIRSAFENLEQNDEHAVADARYYAAMIIRSYALFSQKYFA